MLGQELYPYTWPEYTAAEAVGFVGDAAAIAASEAGEGGTGGGYGQGQPESGQTVPAGDSGLVQGIKDAASAVLTVVEAPFKALGAILQGVQTTGEYLPWILFGLGAVALVVFLPKGGVYRVAPRRRR